MHVKGQDIAILTFGTVQLGLNDSINCLDTAGAYGDSEAVIGNWLKTIANETKNTVKTNDRLYYGIT